MNDDLKKHNLESVNNAKRQFIHATVDNIHDTATLDYIYIILKQALFTRNEERKYRSEL